MKKWEKFSRNELENFIKNSNSIAETAEKIGYSKIGGSGNHETKKMIEYYQFDISHFKGQSWNKNNFDYTRFQYGKTMKIAEAVNAIAYLKGWKCEICQNEKWNNEKIPLEVHHLDGNHLNNQLENLQIICPNCHALTENWRGRNRSKKREEVLEEDFLRALKENKNIRQALLSLGLTAKGGNYARANELIIKYNLVHLQRAPRREIS